MFSSFFHPYFSSLSPYSFSLRHIENILSSPHFLPPLESLDALLSPLPFELLKELLSLSHQLSTQRFGRNIQLFAPLYVSNSCYNICKYCFFSRDNLSPRITLSLDDCHKECLYLSQKGFQHILLLSGEHRADVPPSFFSELVQKECQTFSYFSIETYSLTLKEYSDLCRSGVGGIVFYQETYDPQTYSKLHTAGPKKKFDLRLNTPDLIAQSGIRNIGLGALLGLAPYRQELLCLAYHIQYLMRHYPFLQLSVSFPRLKNTPSSILKIHSISDLELIQIISAFRVVFPTLQIVLSTRETPQLRNEMIPIGVTHMSAESATNPGGYTLHKNTLEQFPTDDHRSVEDVSLAITQKGYQPIWKDWELWTQ